MVRMAKQRDSSLCYVHIQGKLDPIHNGNQTQVVHPNTFMDSCEVHMMALYDTGAATCIVCDDLVGLQLRDE